jgi:hypothetical protein
MPLRGRADQRDPSSRPKQVGDGRVVEDNDVEAPLLEVDQLGDVRDAPILGLLQARASLAYGRPSAAGGTLRPTTPARMMIVSRYGSDA